MIYGPLFLPVRKGGAIEFRRLTEQAIYNALLKRAKQARIAHCSPHDLRRTFASELIDLSSDLSAVKELLAPPGVHEVNFPTIVAGSAGRIAILFPGSESTDFGDADTDDETRPWNIYTVVSVDALKAADPNGQPTFTWTIANPRNDPVHRGTCGPGRCDADDGGSMFDFLDIQVGPDGMFWGTASDTCVGPCVTNPTAQKLRSILRVILQCLTLHR